MVIQRSAKKVSVAAVLFALMVSTVASPYFLNEVFAISRACKNSPECMAAVAREEEANRNAAASSQSATISLTHVSTSLRTISDQSSPAPTTFLTMGTGP